MHRAPGKGTCMTQRHKFRVSGGSNLGISNNAHGQISVLSLITVSCSQILVPKTHFLQTFLCYRDNLKAQTALDKEQIKTILVWKIFKRTLVGTAGFCSPEESAEVDGSSHTGSGLLPPGSACSGRSPPPPARLELDHIDNTHIWDFTRSCELLVQGLFTGCLRMTHSRTTSSK